MLRFLIPRIALRDLGPMIGVAVVGAIVAGGYGMLHDQLTYSISPEYFTKLKFDQFAYADFGFPERVFVAEIGFLATWWVGFVSAWFLARRLVPGQPRPRAFRQIAAGVAIILVCAMMSAFIAYGYGLWRGPHADYSAWRSVLNQLGIEHSWSFVRVAYIHNASYLGGLVGLIVALLIVRPRADCVHPLRSGLDAPGAAAATSTTGSPPQSDRDRGDTVNRVYQIVLIVSTVLGSWIGMQAIHESGHVLGAWLTGGRVERVVLHPLTISRTDLAENPHPLAVAWAGPIGGVAIPLLLWAAAARRLGAFLLRFLAGFCLLANGAYIGVGSFGRLGDCGDLLQHGSPIWLLWLFGGLAAPAGVWLWHGQGPHFGLGPAHGKVSRGATYVSVISCVELLVLGFAVGGK